MEEVVMMEALINGLPEQQVQAALRISTLTGKQKHKLVDIGIINPLISMLQSHDYESVEASLLALLSLAYGSERNKIRIAKSEVIPWLLSLLHCKSPTALIDLAIATLLILSSSTANKLLIASTGAIPVLIELLYIHHAQEHQQQQQQNDDDEEEETNFSTNISTQAKLDAIATLHNLSTCNQILPSLLSSQAPLYLLQIIHMYETSSELVEKAISLLETISSASEPTIRRIARQSGAVQALVETIEEGSPQCKEHGVGILLLICQSCGEEYRGAMLREGAMPWLLQLSVDGTRRAKSLSRRLLLLLRDWSGNGSRKIKQLKKNEFLEHIMERIDSEEDGEFNGNALVLVEQMIANLRV